MRKLGIVGLAAGLVFACTDILHPGTEWVVGTWRLAVPDLTCISADYPPPGFMVLRLDPDGKATLSEDGAARVQTRFSTKRDRSGVGGPLVLEFEKPVLGGTKSVISDAPADTLHLAPADDFHWCRGSKFVRYP